MPQPRQLQLCGARQPLASGHQPARRAREGSGQFRLPRPRSDATISTQTGISLAKVQVGLKEQRWRLPASRREVFEPAAYLVNPPRRLAVGREQQDVAVVDDDLHVALVVLEA